MRVSVRPFCIIRFFLDMVPQQNMDSSSRSEIPTTSAVPMFGSQLVDKNSSTPYSDATQVGPRQVDDFFKFS